eukprot:TRINITY_DN68495_c0_g1_i1.p1 TRINITY_DN68495_c0_g1~~TRINITY_DN68495_c0_g1_i1.p1  ORF type:complete len:259 (+),score=50.14 TRINITY_DN68495_c0_g1_i1:27-779(+)
MRFGGDRETLIAKLSASIIDGNEKGWKRSHSADGRSQLRELERLRVLVSAQIPPPLEKMQESEQWELRERVRRLKSERVALQASVMQLTEELERTRVDNDRLCEEIGELQHNLRALQGQCSGLLLHREEVYAKTLCNCDLLHKCAALLEAEGLHRALIEEAEHLAKPPFSARPFGGETQKSRQAERDGHALESAKRRELELRRRIELLELQVNSLRHEVFAERANHAETEWLLVEATQSRPAASRSNVRL